MFRKIIAAAILSVGALILVLLADTGADRDVIAYWAAGRLLLNGGDPYDPAAVLALEKSVGKVGDTPAMMRNVPFSLPLAAPLGYLSSRGALIVWSLAMMAALVSSVRMIQAMYGKPGDTLALFGYLFAPALVCLIASQSGLFLLFGLVLFLRWYDRRPWLAGACLTLCATKPHLFLSFGLALVAWVVTRRAWRIAGGTVIGIAAALSIPLLIDPQVLSQYANMMRNEGLETLFIPTLGGFLRVALNRNAVWIQFVPAAVACAWTAWYFHKRNAAWDWRGKEGAVVMLVSVLAAPYSWFTDEVVVLPAVMLAAYTADRNRRTPYWLMAAGAIALIEVFAGVEMTSGGYGWTTTAWLLCCAPLLACRSRAAAAQ
jgi:hypothetical protein